MIVSLPSRGFGAAALALGLLLAGCSSDSDVPPTEVSAPGGGTQTNTDTGSGGTFPDINTVPNQRPTSTIQDLVQAPDGLGAAPGGTQYGEALVGGPTSSVEPPAPPPPPPPEDSLAPIPEPGIQTQSSGVQPQPVEAEPVQTPAASSEPIATPEIVEPQPMEPVAPAEAEPAPSTAGQGQTIEGTTAEPAPVDPAVAAQPEPTPTAPEEPAPAAPETPSAGTPQEAQLPPSTYGSNDPAAYGIAAPQTAPSPSNSGPGVAAVPPAVAPGAPVNPQPIGMIYFRDGSSSLSSDDLDVVRQIADLQRAHGGVLNIVGHATTGTTSPAEANQQISEARANAVAQELMKYGVPQSAIRTSGVGTSQPLNADATPSSAAANRRAEIYLTAN